MARGGIRVPAARRIKRRRSRGLKRAKQPLDQPAGTTARCSERLNRGSIKFHFDQDQNRRMALELVDRNLLRKEITMKYRVRFVKMLCDDSGHQHECLEGEIKIRRARSELRAVRAAKLKFQRTKKIESWKTYADTIQVAR
jgi:hypothetical protein